MRKRTTPRDELRGSLALHELDKARAALLAGPIGVLLRVTLAVLFMYLVVIAHLLMGITGVVFISVLFLVAFFIPLLVAKAKSLLANRAASDTQAEKPVAPKLHGHG